MGVKMAIKRISTQAMELAPLVKAVFQVGLGIREATVDSVLSHRQHDALPRTSNDGGTHKDDIFILAIGARLPLGKDSGLFLPYGTLAGDHRLRDEQILGRRQANIRRNTVPGKQADRITHHQLGGGQSHPLAVPVRQHLRRDHLSQTVCHTLGPHLLNKPHAAADEQHG